MLRSLVVSRPLFKAILHKKLPSSSARTSYNISSPIPASRIHSLSPVNKRPALAISKIANISQYATKPSGPPYDRIDPNAEKELASKPLESHPDQVSAESSVRHVFEDKLGDKKDGNMAHGSVKSDLKTIRETFSLTEVPRESFYLGAAGVVPYAITSLSTVYLSYDISHAQANMGQGYLFSPDTALQLLHYIEPIQIGYGAVIISFLGAIHWGLEYAGYGGHQSYSRYAIGVVAPAVAWPTMLMPVETALITQFLSFNFLYFADARATVRGWCPPWYSTYRFVLTFIVGASIVISLIGRGQISMVVPGPDGKMKLGGLQGPAEGMKTMRDKQWENLEMEEKERKEKLAKAEKETEENDDEEEEGSDDEDDDSKDDKDEKQEAKKSEEKDEKPEPKKDEKKESSKGGKK